MVFNATFPYQLLLGPFFRLVIIADAQEIEDILLRSNIRKVIEARHVPEGLAELFILQCYIQ